MAKMDPHKLRSVARDKFQRARYRGLVPPVVYFLCVDCGDPATEYEHRDYRRYMDVEPVCDSCNKRRGPGEPRTDSEPVEVMWWFDSDEKAMTQVDFEFDKKTRDRLTALAKHHGITESDYIRSIILEEMQ